MASDEAQWQPGEPNWELYKKDCKVSKMIIHRQRPTTKFEIPILPKPPRYQGGRAPCLVHVDLQLESDEHLDENKKAFIVDKIILPTEPFTNVHDPRQRRAYYIIGWPDLPGARPVVDSGKAVDYVSPHAIEEWEYRDFLRREEEKKKANEEKEAAEAEAAVAKVKALIAAENGESAGGPDPRILPHGKKKPGRKPGRNPKNGRVVDARAPTPQLDSEQEEMLAKRKQGPSLSTPQKSRIAQLDAEMEMDLLESVPDSMDEDRDDSDDQARRQLESEARSEAQSDTVDSRDDGNYNGLELDDPKPNMYVVGQQSSSLPHNDRPLTQSSAPRVSGGPLASAHPTYASFHEAPSQQPRSSMPQQASLLPVGQGRLSHTPKPASITPIPLPPRPVSLPKDKKPSLSGWAVVSSLESERPIQDQAQASKPSHSFPGPEPAAAAAAAAAARTPSTLHQPSSSHAHSGFTPTNSFTPVGGHFPRPPKRTAEESMESTPSSVRKERKRKAPKLTNPPPAPEPQAPFGLNAPLQEQPEEYVVQRLEGDSYLEGIHWFLVRWEGNWPAEQNPTWEPRSGLPDKLVKQYLKRKAEKEAKAQHAKDTPAKPKQKRQTTLKQQWSRDLNYGSVSEAFEGQLELDRNLGGPPQGSDGADDNNDELAGDGEFFFEVDNKRTAAEHERAAAERKKQVNAQMAADLANM